MKPRTDWRRWSWAVASGSLLVVGGLLAIRLEGALPKGVSREPVEATRSTQAASSNRAMWAKAARVGLGELPVFPAQFVDWADDEPTRLRRAGLLRGPLPLPSDSRQAAGPGCTFDIECDDGLPCTTDRCEIDVAFGPGSGVCTNPLTEAGLVGDCDDGVFCNGVEFCDPVADPTGATCQQGPPAACCTGEYCTEVVARCDAASLIPGKRCTQDQDCGSGTCVHCVPHCTTNAECDDGFRCNGLETCQNPGPSGTCVPGVPFCGANSAVCSEGRCRNIVTHMNQAPPTPCTIDADCNTLQGFTCETTNEQDQSSLALCFLGRCCSSAAEPVCTIQRLAQTPPSACNLAGGSKWYPGDDLRTTADCGDENPTFPGEDLGCPKYSSGIEQTSASVVPAHPVAAGPMSQSAIEVPMPNGPGAAFNRIGDDYSFSNSSHIELRAMRLVGFMSVPDAIFIEFWDANGTFIEDLLFHPSLEPGVNVLYLNQPLIIPPSGRVSAITKREFGLNSKFVWLSASPAATTGTNNANVLFVNNNHNAANYMAPSPGILSFELVGPKVVAPLGGCCDAGGGCSNRLEWDCAGAFQGVGILCNFCAHASNAGTNCGRCAIGGAVCSSDAECGANGPCQATDSVCLGSRCSNDDNANCTVPSVCPARAFICSNVDRECVNDGDCPGGTCGGQGTCLAADCAVLDACGVGACCDPNGTCLLDLPGDCVGPDTFLGLGTVCEPNSCPQPCDPVADPGGNPNLWDCDCSDGRCYTGADDCANAIVHPIPDLDPADPPYIVTISGDRTNASSTHFDPDSCWGPATSVSSDLGWWEAFHLTGSCTRVRFDYCGTTPAQFGDWAFVAKDCGCNELLQPKPDPNLSIQSTADRGPPFCNDDNLWVIMSLMRPGTYYIPVNSTLEDVLGDYQLHIVAEACPDAACCLPNGTCQDGINQFECDDLNGTFLAPPQRFPPVATCVPGPGGTCDTGSCCVGPGLCEDETAGTPMTDAMCAQTYVGNLRCEGCDCEDNSAYSCNDHNDCLVANGGPGGLCDLDNCAARSVAQPNPCPICEFEGTTNCNKWDNPSGFSTTISELSLGAGLVAADDFIPLTGVTQIAQVCVWGSYFFADPDVPGLDCHGQVSNDHFRVRVLSSTPEGLPDSSPGGIVGVTTANSVKGEIVLPASLQVGDGYATFGYQLTLDNPITGLNDSGTTQYWLEVANNLNPADGCFWLWSQISDESPQGNDFSAAGSDAGGYVIGAERAVDQAFCISPGGGAPGNFDTPAEPIHPCCTCDGVCLADTLAVCNTVSAEYHIDENSCTGLCPAQGQPANDDCANAAAAYVGTTPVSTLCTTTDGVNPVDCEGDPFDLQNDVWFEFVAPQTCTLRVDMCATGDSFDSALAVYSDGSGSCQCPTTPSVAAATFVECSDEGCAAGASAEGAGFVEIPATQGQCFMIRVGMYPGGPRGTGLIDISCGGPVCGNNSTEPANNEECDGVDDDACPGSCAADCTCGAFATCGDGVVTANEQCDPGPPLMDANCPGLCLFDCSCDSVCGNGIQEPSEECDGPASTACGGTAGRCLIDCTCPPVACGNGFKDPIEQCDPGDPPGIPPDDALCPGECRLPLDPAGECTCECGPVGPPPVTPEPGGVQKPRFIAFVVPPAAGTDTALRVRLATLNHPRLCCTDATGASCSATPCDNNSQCPSAPFLTCAHGTAAGGAPDYSCFEGETRYVNSFPGGSLVCPDDGAPFNTTYRCATLGCDPEYRDWATDLGVAVNPAAPPGLLFVTGDVVLPSSTLEVSHIADSCGAAPGANTCATASTPLAIGTSAWGDIGSPPAGPPDGIADMNDVDLVQNKLLGVLPFFSEPRSWLKQRDPQPNTDPITPVDFSDSIDAADGDPYPASRIADACSHDTNPSGPGPVTCPSAPGPEPLLPETGGVNKNRFLAFEVPVPAGPNRGPGATTAIRVELTTLNHPRFCYASADVNGFGLGSPGGPCNDSLNCKRCSNSPSTYCTSDSNCPTGAPGLCSIVGHVCAHQATPGQPFRCCSDTTATSCHFVPPATAATCVTDADCAGVPGFPECEPAFKAAVGKIRYVRSFPGGSLDCADDGPPFHTQFKCATLGCDPEYRDWSADVGVCCDPASPGNWQVCQGTSWYCGSDADCKVCVNNPSIRCDFDSDCGGNACVAGSLCGSATSCTTDANCTAAPLTKCCRALYVTADALVPSSTLRAEHIENCGTTGADAKCCPSASMPLPLSTARWGDLSSAAFGPPDGRADVLDLAAVFNKLAGIPTCVPPPCSFIFPEHRAWLKQDDPIPNLDAITITDVADVRDAGGYEMDYPARRSIDACSHDPVICP